MQKITILSLLPILLISCAPVRVMQSWNEVSASKAAYKNCLLENSQKPEKCTSLKEAYEADLQVYESADQPTKSGPSINNTINNR
jgi:hypothetical protein